MDVVKISQERVSGLYHLRSVNEQGMTVETDGSPAIGGEGLGVRPMELLLAALGSCSTIDVVLILKKQRQQLVDIKVDITAEKEKVDHHSEYKRIHLTFKLMGRIKPEKAKKAIELSLDEYCSVAMALKKTSIITYDFEILEAPHEKE